MIENKKTIDRGKRYPRIVKGLAAFHRKHWSLGFLYDDVTVVWYENDTFARIRLRAMDRNSESCKWILLLDGTLPCTSKDELRQITLDIKKVVSWCVRNHKRISIAGNPPKESVYGKRISIKQKGNGKSFLVRVRAYVTERLERYWNPKLRPYRTPRVIHPYTPPPEVIPLTHLELLTNKLGRLNPYLFEFNYCEDDIGDVANLSRTDLDAITTIVKIVRELLLDTGKLENPFTQLNKLSYTRSTDTSIRDVLRQLLGKLIVEQPQPINNSFVDTVEYVINLRPTTITPPAPISQIVDWYYEIARVLTAFENAVTGQGKFTHSDDLKGDIQRLIDSLPMEDLNQQLLNPTPTRSQSYNHLRIYRLLKDFFKTL